MIKDDLSQKLLFQSQRPTSTPTYASQVVSKITSRSYLRIIMYLLIIATIYVVCSTLIDLTSTSVSSSSSYTDLKARLMASEASWKIYVKKRNAIVGKKPEKINPWSPKVYYWEYFVPTFSCPHSVDRVGRLGDGGKFVCGIELFEKDNINNNKPCVVYSFGIASESSYEAELLKRTNCKIYGFDGSVNKMGPQIKTPNPRVKFNKIFIGKNKNSTTLRDLMKKNGDEWIDFLKIDIESAEFAVLNQVMDDFEILPFGQLSIEFHNDSEGKDFKKFYKFWERLEAKGLRAFKNEINFYTCVVIKSKPFLMEYSFINIKGGYRNRLING